MQDCGTRFRKQFLFYLDARGRTFVVSVGLRAARKIGELAPRLGDDFIHFALIRFEIPSLKEIRDVAVRPNQD